MPGALCRCESLFNLRTKGASSLEQVRGRPLAEQGCSQIVTRSDLGGDRFCIWSLNPSWTMIVTTALNWNELDVHRYGIYALRMLGIARDVKVQRLTPDES